MSMRDYAVSDYGLLLDDETMKIILSRVYPDYTDEDDMAYELYSEGICEYISEFTGESMPIRDNGELDWVADSEDYRNDVIAFVSISNLPSLFKKAYENMDELIDELKEKLGEYLPDGFDYRSRIRYICGTYFG